MPTREKFFKRPTTVRDMVGGRRVLSSTPNTIVDVIDGMRPGQALVVDYDVVPDIDPNCGNSEGTDTK